MVTLTMAPSENLNIPEEKMEQETMENEDAYSDEVPDYELCREQRIKENRERMQKLGILDLSVEFKSLKPTPNRSYRRKTPQRHSPLPSSGPTRRSSRLQNSTPVSYCEVQVPKKDKSWNDVDYRREEGSKPEIYTDEHEKLLGTTEKDWTLFVDGYGKDGKRIYDPVKGKTCHQCRQKTLGHRTHCIKCNMVQGQFCGDCLYMRYGENVLEANANPDWMCPVCRGICNCSLCRQAKGWPPTGMLYRKISSLGYKSVAHYLIQTRRSNTDSDENAGDKVPISAKRSLPFSDFDSTKGDDDLSKTSNEYSNSAPLSESNQEFGDSKIAAESSIAMESLNDHFHTESSNKDLAPETVERGDDIEIKKEENFIPDNEDFIAPEATPKSTRKKHVLSEPTTDSIARRLRQRRNNTNKIEETRNKADASKLDDDNEIKKEENFIPENEDFISPKATPESTRKKHVLSEPTTDSIARRLRQRRDKTNKTDETKSEEEPSKIADVDSIGSRLRARRRVVQV